MTAAKTPGRVIPDFPDYRIARDGTLYMRTGDTWQARARESGEKRGYILRRDGKAYRRSVNALLRAVYGEAEPPGAPLRSLNGRYCIDREAQVYGRTRHGDWRSVQRVTTTSVRLIATHGRYASFELADLLLEAYGDAAPLDVLDDLAPVERVRRVQLESDYEPPAPPQPCERWDTPRRVVHEALQRFGWALAARAGTWYVRMDGDRRGRWIRPNALMIVPDAAWETRYREQVRRLEDAEWVMMRTAGYNWREMPGLEGVAR